ncbi:MAG: TRAP transporter substrate-binding protein DctP, partial [Pseudomonadota bacterium]
MKYFLTLFLWMSLTTVVNAQIIKLATLFPEGTRTAEILKTFSKNVENKTSGRVKFKIYFGGAQGDEADVLRKMHIGQLHGGIFTGRTLSEVNGDIRVMELPFNFKQNLAKGLQVLNKMVPFFNKGIEKNGYKSLGIFELGPIYLGSVKKAGQIKELAGIKIWSWEGDPLVATIIENMGFVSVPLPLPEVLPSLSTGLVEAAYGPPGAMVALQWSNKFKYLFDLPISYSVGAFLVVQKEW